MQVEGQHGLSLLRPMATGACLQEKLKKTIWMVHLDGEGERVFIRKFIRKGGIFCARFYALFIMIIVKKIYLDCMLNFDNLYGLRCCWEQHLAVLEKED